MNNQGKPITAAMNMELIIEANLEDLDNLSELFDEYRVSYNEPTDLPGSRNFLQARLTRKDSMIMLAVNGNKIIGFAQLYPLFSSLRMKRVWLLNDLYVQPAFRKQGYSKILIDKCKDYCRYTHAAGLLFRSAPADTVMHHLCPAVGFRLDDENREYFWENAAL